MDYGLEQVVAAETVLSHVDGAAGRLIIRGAPLEAIAGRIGFEAVVHLLLEGFFDDLADAPALRSTLAAARADVFERVRNVLPQLGGLEVYDGVRAGIALLPDGHGLDDALRLIAAPAVLTCALIRQNAGEMPIPPNPGLSHADDVVAMLGGDLPGAGKALDTYLVTVCDHGLNASTFAARVVASTRTGLASCVLAGMGALKGPLHGGAPGPVIEMLDAIAAECDARGGDARDWLEREVASGARLMGFGHRIYRVRDPRADALKRALALLPTHGGRLAFAEAVERTALDVLRRKKPGRVLETNVEFYTALLLEAIGFPAAAFTCVFAMGRTLGWIAHAREQAATGRLIRPQSRYIGPRVDLAA